MERVTPQSIGDILRVALQDNRMQERLDECKAVELWASVAGHDIARKCSRPTVRNGVMTIGVPNASLRNELTMNRSSLRDAINSLLRKQTITDLRFLS